jgi:pimeloyl-ACP methyl ester carboxylesterase
MRAALATALVLVLLSAAPASAQEDPIFQAPGIPPPGANDPDCRPAAGHPSPVILVHGTFGDMTVSWNTVAPALRSKGFCVWALDYGRRATAPIDRSADELEAFIDMVRARTGAAKVSLIGHSQGGMLSRYVAVRRGRLDAVDDIIGFAPSSHGTTNPLAGPAGWFGCTACAEQEAGSAFMRKVNEPPPEAPGPAWYTVLTTTHDEVVTPYQSQALAGDHATNVILQDKCPADHFEHVTIVGDPVALQWAVNALERPGAANPRFEPDCTGLSYGHDPDAPAPSAGRPPAAGTPLRVGLGRRAAKVKRRRAGIRVRCAGPEGAVCIGRLELRRAKRLLGARRFRVAAGSSRVVRVRVGKARRVRARALMPRPGGGVQVASRRYRLR